MKVEHCITISESDLKRIVANHFKDIKNGKVSFYASQNFYGDLVSVSATIRYTDDLEEKEE